MSEERRDVGPERQAFEMTQVIGHAPPVLLFKDRTHDRIGDRLDAAKDVREDLGGARRQAQAAAPQHAGGHAVAQGLGQRRVELDFGVVMGMDVEEAGGHPAARGVDLLDPRAGGQGLLGDRGDDPALDPDVPADGGRA